jgi:hypothetical protein
MNKVLAVDVKCGWFVSGHRSSCGDSDELDTMEIIALGPPNAKKGCQHRRGEELNSERNV